MNKAITQLVLAFSLTLTATTASAVVANCDRVNGPGIGPYNPTYTVSWGAREGTVMNILSEFAQPVLNEIYSFERNIPINQGGVGFQVFYLAPGGIGTWLVDVDAITFPRLFADDCTKSQFLI